ncbi:23S rRNA pseudouridine(1911/1915/1917) synthase RluD [Aliidiomarina quisquiliarum]|uniref:23S rRNA pseudouridine(1911/1915/1917) synthase RluD n=1 Tax=Aliidiomarina quisquiliarum TaxID=2938947 RepID=UPI00208F9C3C|nr:23S rRNA pseudouridine(1911/1915/1917) synthase RluD [Aliidiomarina quisquiliarum]MCO4322077.1 23S rRNA pseudouridine(1911/1915/1917) synthase RluD [Aliidiomarina quisquiliarum]
MTNQVRETAIIPEEALGLRFDQALASMFPEFSRSLLKKWVQNGAITLDGVVVTKPREKIVPGMEVTIAAEQPVEVENKAQAIDLDIVYEDDALLVIDKPAGLVVHPGAGNTDGTLLNALLHHCADLEQLPRSGIVHRLDKETSGLMVVAKTMEAYARLTRALKARNVIREYEAVVVGVLTAGGSVNAAIGRHPSKRTHMAVLKTGKDATTHYRVIERLRAHSYLRLRLESGRTHQIRVHMAHIKHPIVGDPQYGGRPRPPANVTDELAYLLRSFPRQALHAVHLSFAHPVSGEMMAWTSALPADMQKLIKALRLDKEEHI